MRYTIRRVSLLSALKIGLLLGWVVALLPALACAAAAVALLRGAAAAFGEVQAYEITLLGQNVARIDLLPLLGLADEAARVSDLAAQGWGLFGLIALVLTLLGGAGVATTTVLFSLAYNLLATAVGGLAVELREAP